MKEITSANEKKQVPLHFILPSQKYKEPGFELMGYKSQQAELGAVVKMLKVVDIYWVDVRPGFLESGKNIQRKLLYSAIANVN